jgi:hypothetical protein
MGDAPHGAIEPSMLRSLAMHRKRSRAQGQENVVMLARRVSLAYARANSRIVRRLRLHHPAELSCVATSL